MFRLSMTVCLLVTMVAAADFDSDSTEPKSASHDSHDRFRLLPEEGPLLSVFDGKLDSQDKQMTGFCVRAEITPNENDKTMWNWKCREYVTLQAEGCFSGMSMVHTPDGVIPLKDVQVGQVVLDRDHAWTKVYAMTTAKPHDMHGFLHIETESASLTVTAGHLLLAGSTDTFEPARDFVVGDTIVTPTGMEVIRFISFTMQPGLFSPKTESGTLFVDNVLSSDLSDMHPRWMPVARVWNRVRHFVGF